MLITVLCTACSLQ